MCACVCVILLGYFGGHFSASDKLITGTVGLKGNRSALLIRKRLICGSPVELQLWFRVWKVFLGWGFLCALSKISKYFTVIKIFSRRLNCDLPFHFLAFSFLAATCNHDASSHHHYQRWRPRRVWDLASRRIRLECARFKSTKVCTNNAGERCPKQNRNESRGDELAGQPTHEQIKEFFLKNSAWNKHKCLIRKSNKMPACIETWLPPCAPFSRSSIMVSDWIEVGVFVFPLQLEGMVLRLGGAGP